MEQEKSRALSAATRLVAVFGHPVRHSASPAMHNAALAVLGLDWCYVGCDVAPEHLAEALAGARVMGFVGLNLTVPHKLLAVPMMDVLSPAAERWGAVNTVVFEACDRDGSWCPVGRLQEVTGRVRAHGHNTDADALLRSLREDLGIEPRDARVLLLGTGGAGRTAALRLAEEGVAELHLVNRSAGKARALAAEINRRYPAVAAGVGYPDSDVEILLNATSLGMEVDDPLPLDGQVYPLERVDAVYDMIYRPAETRLLEAARLAGCRTANGLGMLLHQGVAALELWSGREVPVDRMRTALMKEIYG